ncbi:MAG: hypothetical protein EA409_02725 [Saprospirales bacterium]|nr:MAG: hypothetical protein EA409_02725 [Saprospirales bacterium]
MTKQYDSERLLNGFFSIWRAINKRYAISWAPLLASFFFLGSIDVIAQSGGRQVYQFLNLPGSARVLGLGGYQPTLSDGDINLAYENSAALNADMHQAISFNHAFYFSGVQFGYATYGHQLENLGISLAAGIRYINYGTFEQTNELGDVTGEFDASEIAIGITASKQLYDRLRLGATMRFVQSSFETYVSTAMAFDIGALYEIEERRLAFSLVMKNFGFQLSRFFEEREPMPFDLRAGVSKRLEHLPFRFSVTAHNLHRWDINYDDPAAQQSGSLFGDEDDEDPRFSPIDNFFRHLIFSGEFYLGPNEQFQLRLAYNHLLAREMALPDTRVLSGISFGVGFRVNRFRIDYGFGRYHTGANANKISISTNISEFRRNIL